MIPYLLKKWDEGMQGNNVVYLVHEKLFNKEQFDEMVEAAQAAVDPDFPHHAEEDEVANKLVDMFDFVVLNPVQTYKW